MPGTNEELFHHSHAGMRFWVVLWVLLFASVLLALTIWNQIQQLFGL